MPAPRIPVRPERTPRPRRRSPWRDYPSLLWLIAAVVIALIHRWVPAATWLMIHMVLLGAISHSIMVWSRYFTQALTKVPTTEATLRAESGRIMLLQAGSVAVMVGYPVGWWALLISGALAVAASVLWHGAALARMVKDSLAPNFTVTVRYYQSATLALVVGAALGALQALVPHGDWSSRLLTAHMAVNIFGWIGLTVTGTLITFWPTLLGTRMDRRAARWAQQALPVLAVSLAILIAGTMLGLRWVALIGLAGYLVGLGWWGRALIRPLRAQLPRTFAPASVLASMPWFLVGLGWIGYLLVTDGWDAVTAQADLLAGILAVGFALQLLTGAMTHLIPTVLRGGPAVVRANIARYNKGAALRLTIINGGLLLFLLPLPSWVSVTVSSAVLLALAAFIPLTFAVIISSAKAKRKAAQEAPSPENQVPAPRPFTARTWLVGLLVLGLVAAAGVAVDPAAVGLGSGQPSTSSQLKPTGETVRVNVEAKDMRFYPNKVEANPGDRVIIDLVNKDSDQTHDLRVGGISSDRMAPGKKTELDLGVVEKSQAGWCTIAGHRQMGMTFDVVVKDTGAGGTADAESDADQDNGDRDIADPGKRVQEDPDAKLAHTVDPELKPLESSTKPRTRKVRIEVTEEPLEVAPGVWQKRWTYNGGPVGPTLHGRVGDRFEVTLVNKGTMGHSIDFHASSLAPDGGKKPMRTIQPGKSLKYNFTAERAGMWMYHCGTAPVANHIAAGMSGAVVIEPEGMEQADREYALVQSETYMGNAAAKADDAVEVNGAKVDSRNPDFVVFNGVANQYRQEPLKARVGENVRFWVLDVGPNLPTSFHVIGSQFHTVYKEGGYRLKDGRDAFDSRDGGSQALDLEAAQGGFVEAKFPEAGNYTMMDHVMSDGERGAAGTVRVED